MAEILIPLISEKYHHIRTIGMLIQENKININKIKCKQNVN